MTSLGIYPGTFDPIHKGHIAFAKAALTDCSLDKVFFLPETIPRAKPQVSDIDARFSLITKDTARTPMLDVLKLPSSQFTVESTLPEIKKVVGSAKLTFLVGSDILVGMKMWPGITALLADCNLAVGLRHNANETEVHKHIDELAQKINHRISYRIIKTEHSHLASSNLRQRP